MALTGNKGEWSEIYTLFKLLGDKQVFAGDGTLHKIKNLYYPILEILRSEKSSEYKYKINDDIVIVTEDGSEKLRISVLEFLNKSRELLSIIKESRGTFSNSEIEDFMNLIYCHTLKASSKDKTDIRIVIHDLRTGMNPTLGFSIKSQLGNKSTLLNPSKATNFVYKICSSTLSDESIKEINDISTKSKVHDRIRRIKDANGCFVFQGVDNHIFNNNLILIDSCLPQILSEVLLEYFSTNHKTMKEIITVIKNRNPLHYDISDNHKFYEYKIKCFLTDIALGMMPATVWSGKYEANGGYLVVKENGDILCYHIYDRNNFEDYLYNNTVLETPSTTRYNYGFIEISNINELSIKLNLQVRFSK